LQNKASLKIYIFNILYIFFIIKFYNNSNDVAIPYIFIFVNKGIYVLIINIEYRLIHTIIIIIIQQRIKIYNYVFE